MRQTRTIKNAEQALTRRGERRAQGRERQREAWRCRTIKKQTKKRTDLRGVDKNSEWMKGNRKRNPNHD